MSLTRFRDVLAMLAVAIALSVPMLAILRALVTKQPCRTGCAVAHIGEKIIAGGIILLIVVYGLVILAGFVAYSFGMRRDT